MSEKQNFKMQWSRLKYPVIALLTFAVIQILRLFFVTSTGDIEEDWGLVYMHRFSFLCFLLPILYFLPKKLRFVANLAVVLVTPALCLYIIQYMCWPVNKLSTSVLILNLAVIYVFAVLLVFLIGRTDISMSILLIFSIFYSCLNYYVLMYRGYPILPSDISAAGTAMSVVDRYSYYFIPSIGLLVTFALLGISFNILCNISISLKTQPILRVSGVVLSLIAALNMVSYLKSKNAADTFGLQFHFFSNIDITIMCQNNGLVANFVSNLKFLSPDMPQSYSDDYVSQIVEEHKSNEIDDSLSTPPQNIIVILNETFADLSVFSEYTTNQEVLPFLNSLTENTVRGNLHVSVKGGGTANTEFEVLSSMSIAFLPYGSIAYLQFLEADSSYPTLVSRLSSLGYTTTAMHPSAPSNYNRNNLYSAFGFDNIYFFDELSALYPEETMTYDQPLYTAILDKINTEEDPQFIFCLTMQNHGGYDENSKNFPLTTYIEGLEDDHQTSLYLSLIHESDNALKYLLTELSASDERTLVLFFGDHQPNNTVTDTIANFSGIRFSEGTVDYDEMYYITPYLFWANYDIDYESFDDISPNYLSAILAEIAGLPRLESDTFMLELLNEYPVITTRGFINKNGELINESKYSSIPLLNQYACLQYNYMFGNRISGFWEYN